MRSLVYTLPLILYTPLSSAITFDCTKIKVDSVAWNLEKLGGSHQISWIRPHVDLIYNTTFKIDICKALVLKNEKEKKECGDGTRICATEYHFDGDKEPEHVGSWPITREYIHDGARIEPKFTRLKTSKGSDEEEPLEGLILELGGGELDKQSQKAKINLTCISKDEKEERKLVEAVEDGKNDEENGDEKKRKAAGKTEDGAGGRIEFVSYDEKELELNWLSPYACENAASAPGEDTKQASGSWGFFSWFFFLVFMLLVAFVLFTAWVNYTRNGARGWDLLPFSDTLRDLPYILGDWSRKIASTLGGGGTRGGYSAV